MPEWHHCCIPRVRRNSNERQPTCILISVPPKNYETTTHRIVTGRWLSQDGFVDRYFVPLPENHCVQQRRLPVGGAMSDGSTIVLRTRAALLGPFIDISVSVGIFEYESGVCEREQP